MPWVMQMFGFVLLLLGIGIALWVSLWLLIALFAIGIGAVIYSHIRDFLMAKGILNPTPGIPPQPADITVVEGDFTRIDSTSTLPK